MIIELNTMDDPRPWFHDETVRARCARCGHLFRLGRGMDEEPIISRITRKHMEICEGDAAVTLMKIEQLYKAGWRPEAG